MWLSLWTGGGQLRSLRRVHSQACTGCCANAGIAAIFANPAPARWQGLLSAEWRRGLRGGSRTFPSSAPALRAGHQSQSGALTPLLPSEATRRRAPVLQRATRRMCQRRPPYSRTVAAAFTFVLGRRARLPETPRGRQSVDELAQSTHALRGERWRVAIGAPGKAGAVGWSARQRVRFERASSRPESEAFKGRLAAGELDGTRASWRSADRGFGSVGKAWISASLASIVQPTVASLV